MNTTVLIGSTVPAFAEIAVTVPEGATKDEALSILEKAKSAAESSGALDYKPDWSTQQDVRAIAAKNDFLNSLITQIQLDDPADEPVTQRVKCWYSLGCSLVTDEPVPGLNLRPLQEKSACFIGAKYRIADNMDIEVARALAKALHLDFQEGPKPKPILTESQAHAISIGLWKGLGVKCS